MHFDTLDATHFTCSFSDLQPFHLAVTQFSGNSRFIRCTQVKNNKMAACGKERVPTDETTRVLG